MTNFPQVQESMECPFSPDSEIHCCPPVCAEAYDASALQAAALDVLSAIDDSHTLDGVVVTFSPRSWGDSLDSLCVTLYRLLRSLGDHDNSARLSLSGHLEEPSWRFQLRETAFFALVLAPVYPPTSSRHNFGGDETFVLFQPAAAFARRHPPGHDRIPLSVRELIRRRFHASAKPYDARLSTGPLEALRFIKPLTLDAPGVRWWELAPRSGE